MWRNHYCTIGLFGTCGRKTTFWELHVIGHAGAPIVYILWLTSMRLYSNRGACSLRGACAKKCDNTVPSPTCTSEGQKSGCIICVGRVIRETIGLHYILWIKKLSCSVLMWHQKTSMNAYIKVSLTYLHAVLLQGMAAHKHHIPADSRLIQSVRSAAASL